MEKEPPREAPLDPVHGFTHPGRSSSQSAFGITLIA